MRSVPGTLLVFVVATLLVVTTPIGTGDGVHQDAILHPVLPHLHLINGRLVAHFDSGAPSARTPLAPRTTARPVLGAGSGADAAGLGMAIYPNLPVAVLVLPTVAVGRAARPEQPLPNEFLDAPPDPPPNAA